MQKTANDFPNNGDWKCEACIFFKEMAPDYGYCRRHPPTVREASTISGSYGDWPIVRPESWCGEWVSFERK